MSQFRPGEQFEVKRAMLRDWSQPGIITWNDLHRLYGEHNISPFQFVGNYALAKSQIVFQSRDKIHLIDFAQQSITPLLEGKDVLAVGTTEQIVEFSVLPGDEPLPGDDLIAPLTFIKNLSFAALTPDSVIVFHSVNAPLVEYQLPPRLAGQRVSFCLADDDTLILTKQVENSFRIVSPGVSEIKTEYTRISPSGEVLTQQVITRRNPHHGGYGEVSDTVVMNVAALAVPGTLTSTLFAGGLLPLLNDRGSNPISERITESLGMTWPAILIATLLSAGLCWFVVRRQAEYRLPHSYGWLVFVFLLGLPGYLGYRFHRKWPVKDIPPAPVSTGCEIFAA